MQDLRDEDLRFKMASEYPISKQRFSVCPSEDATIREVATTDESRKVRLTNTNVHEERPNRSVSYENLSNQIHNDNECAILMDEKLGRICPEFPTSEVVVETSQGGSLMKIKEQGSKLTTKVGTGGTASTSVTTGREFGSMERSIKGGELLRPIESSSQEEHELLGLENKICESDWTFTLRTDTGRLLTLSEDVNKSICDGTVLPVEICSSSEEVVTGEKKNIGQQVDNCRSCRSSSGEDETERVESTATGKQVGLFEGKSGCFGCTSPWESECDSLFKGLKDSPILLLDSSSSEDETELMEKKMLCQHVDKIGQMPSGLGELLEFEKHDLFINRIETSRKPSGWEKREKLGSEITRKEDECTEYDSVKRENSLVSESKNGALSFYGLDKGKISPVSSPLSFELSSSEEDESNIAVVKEREQVNVLIAKLSKHKCPPYWKSKNGELSKDGQDSEDWKNWPIEVSSSDEDGTIEAESGKTTNQVDMMKGKGVAEGFDESKMTLIDVDDVDMTLTDVDYKRKYSEFETSLLLELSSSDEGETEKVGSWTIAKQDDVMVQKHGNPEHLSLWESKSSRMFPCGDEMSQNVEHCRSSLIVSDESEPIVSPDADDQKLTKSLETNAKEAVIKDATGQYYKTPFWPIKAEKVQNSGGKETHSFIKLIENCDMSHKERKKSLRKKRVTMKREMSKCIEEGPLLDIYVSKHNKASAGKIRSNDGRKLIDVHVPLTTPANVLSFGLTDTSLRGKSKIIRHMVPSAFLMPRNKGLGHAGLRRKRERTYTHTDESRSIAFKPIYLHGLDINLRKASNHWQGAVNRCIEKKNNRNPLADCIGNVPAGHPTSIADTAAQIVGENINHKDLLDSISTSSTTSGDSTVGSGVTLSDVYISDIDKQCSDYKGMGMSSNLEIPISSVSSYRKVPISNDALKNSSTGKCNHLGEKDGPLSSIVIESVWSLSSTTKNAENELKFERLPKQMPVNFSSLITDANVQDIDVAVSKESGFAKGMPRLLRSTSEKEASCFKPGTLFNDFQCVARRNASQSVSANTDLRIAEACIDGVQRQSQSHDELERRGGDTSHETAFTAKDGQCVNLSFEHDNLQENECNDDTSQSRLPLKDSMPKAMVNDDRASKISNRNCEKETLTLNSLQDYGPTDKVKAGNELELTRKQSTGADKGGSYDPNNGKVLNNKNVSRSQTLIKHFASGDDARATGQVIEREESEKVVPEKGTRENKILVCEKTRAMCEVDADWTVPTEENNEGSDTKVTNGIAKNEFVTIGVELDVNASNTLDACKSREACFENNEEINIRHARDLGSGGLSSKKRGMLKAKKTLEAKKQRKLKFIKLMEKNRWKGDLTRKRRFERMKAKKDAETESLHEKLAKQLFADEKKPLLRSLFSKVKVQWLKENEMNRNEPSSDHEKVDAESAVERAEVTSSGSCRQAERQTVLKHESALKESHFPSTLINLAHCKERSFLCGINGEFIEELKSSQNSKGILSAVELKDNCEDDDFYPIIGIKCIMRSNLLFANSPTLVTKPPSIPYSVKKKDARKRRKECHGFAGGMVRPQELFKDNDPFAAFPISSLLWKNIRYNEKLIGRKRLLLPSHSALFSWECWHMFRSRKISYDRHSLRDKLMEHEVRARRIRNWYQNLENEKRKGLQCMSLQMNKHRVEEKGTASEKAMESTFSMQRNSRSDAEYIGRHSATCGDVSNAISYRSSSNKDWPKHHAGAPIDDGKAHYSNPSSVPTSSQATTSSSIPRSSQPYTPSKDCPCSMGVKGLGRNVFEDSIRKLARSLSRRVLKRKLTDVDGNVCNKCNAVLSNAKELTRHMLYHLVDRAVDNSFHDGDDFNEGIKLTDLKGDRSENDGNKASSCKQVSPNFDSFNGSIAVDVAEPSKDRIAYKARLWVNHEASCDVSDGAARNAREETSLSNEKGIVWKPLCFNVPIKPVKWRCLNCKKTFRNIREMKLHDELCSSICKESH